MTSERVQMLNIFSDEKKKGPEYLSTEWEYLTDDNSTSYSSSSDSVKITYDTTPFSSKFVNYCNSYIAIPFSISNGSYTSASIVALKQSFLSLISGIVLTTATGESIFNQPPSSCMDLFNNMRLICMSTSDEIKDLKEILALQKDENIDSSNPLISAPHGFINCLRPISMTGTVSSFLPADTYGFFPPTSQTGLYGGFNHGLEYRKNRTMATLAGTEFTIYAAIPLRFLHDFFTHLNFPMLGANFRLEITLNSAAKSLISYTSQTDATALAPTVRIATAIDNSGNRTRLYLQTVKMPPDVLSETLTALNSGVVKRFTFYDPIVYRKNGWGTSTSMNDVLTQSVVKPYRLMMMGAMTGRVIETGNVLAPANSILNLDKFNLKINGSPFFKQSLSSKNQQYEEFLRAWGVKDTPDSALTQRSYINFDDFKGLYALTSADLSGVKKLLSSETTPCYIELDCTRNSATDIDLIVWIEREMIAEISMNGKDLKVRVSQ